MGKHTKGPWHTANGCQIRSAKHQIARAWMMRNGEGAANAALIAAAPDLLEALELLLETRIQEKHAWNWQPGESPLHDRCKSAIARAKGEE